MGWGKRKSDELDAKAEEYGRERIEAQKRGDYWAAQAAGAQQNEARSEARRLRRRGR